MRVLQASLIFLALFCVVACVRQSGSFTDFRDGKEYKIVKIGTQIWMVENLNYETPSGSWCNENSPDNCSKYGRLYDWNAAKVACPLRWHLPTNAEWDNLAKSVGGKRDSLKDEMSGTGRIDYYWTPSGKTLKATSGWDKNGNGTDDFRFSALPGGYSIDDIFYNYGDLSNWWTATEGSSGNAYSRSIHSDYDNVYEDSYYVEAGFSVRCVQD
ncbi:MAG: fibrobacter succinogenes major paralogous domain-containing protein [Fibromonadaceae bacterium]|jgi:uncharacterized protein (TIGR02145 family)|nr:fibrobacter succinogenes major paralogous domain-containing protein [Fibromonadaceae bacterium]